LRAQGRTTTLLRTQGQLTPRGGGGKRRQATGRATNRSNATSKTLRQGLRQAFRRSPPPPLKSTPTSLLRGLSRTPTPMSLLRRYLGASTPTSSPSSRPRSKGTKWICHHSPTRRAMTAWGSNAAPASVATTWPAISTPRPRRIDTACACTSSRAETGPASNSCDTTLAEVAFTTLPSRTSRQCSATSLAASLKRPSA